MYAKVTSLGVTGLAGYIVQVEADLSGGLLSTPVGNVVARVIKGDVNRSVRNLADLPVATPALELTLTDLQDQPLVRRVLRPAELGAPPALAAHGEFSASHVITLNASAASTAVTGYRLMAFYP